MKDHVEIGHLTKYNAFRVNRNQAMNLEICFSNSLIIHMVISQSECPILVRCMYLDTQ